MNPWLKRRSDEKLAVAILLVSQKAGLDLRLIQAG